MIPLARKIRTTSTAMLGLLSLIVTSLPAQAACYGWPLREYHGEYAYDGDTIYVAIPGFPGEVVKLAVRGPGVEPHEILRKCES